MLFPQRHRTVFPAPAAGKRRGRGVFLLALALLLPSLAPGQQPSASGESAAGPAAAATVLGTVKDTNGNIVPNATVKLTPAASNAGAPPGGYSTEAGSNGFFSLSVAAGSYTVTISAPGLDRWKTALTVKPGEFREVPNIVMNVSAVVSTVEVNGSEHAIATREMHAEEQQRILGAIPNFYVSYLPSAAPLSPGQKFNIAWKSSIDPVNLLIDAATAGIEQGENAYPGYGQGMAGYGKRFGAAYADDVVSTMVGGAILPSLLHQDPRFFYHSGSARSRILYSLFTVVACKGDNGRWQPNYSYIGGNFVSGAVSNLYYPPAQRGVETTVNTALITTAMGAVSSLAQEFVLRRFTTHSGRGH